MSIDVSLSASRNTPSSTPDLSLNYPLSRCRVNQRPLGYLTERPRLFSVVPSRRSSPRERARVSRKSASPEFPADRRILGRPWIGVVRRPHKSPSYLSADTNLRFFFHRPGQVARALLISRPTDDPIPRGIVRACMLNRRTAAARRQRVE